MKKFWLGLILFSFLLPIAIAEDRAQSMQDALGRAFQAVKAKNHEEAVQLFEKAGQLAIQISEWKGCLDAGNALLKLGEANQSLSLFESALPIAQKQGDWRIFVASGYALASLPQNLNAKDKAIHSFILAAQAAKQKKDWMGLTEAANGLNHLENQPAAVQALNDAREIVQETKSLRGAQVLAELYQKSGLPNESQQMKIAKEEFARIQGHAEQSQIEPPPGWNPVGESVSRPPVPNIEQQRMARQSADKDIEEKNQWIVQQKQLELEKEKMASQYSGYYYYPYGYDSYTSYEPWGWDLLIPWADYYGSSYVYTDGYYHYSGDYVGFGFAYGYSDGNSFFGVSLQVYD
ncbi:MAG: hypothetical protein HYS07_11135 [Chlamydiae bacterium]|nr:hypothetical protein [Chlamydiota bacterium]MBI3278175.1 hypothetical protein [Chlamydiota bacterium]